MDVRITVQKITGRTNYYTKNYWTYESMYKNYWMYESMYKTYVLNDGDHREMVITERW